MATYNPVRPEAAVLTWLLARICCAACLLTAAYAEDAVSVLQARCTPCHGSKTRIRDLDVSSAEAVLRGSESGPVVVPGKPEASRLYRSVVSGAMPPGGRLSEREAAALRSWIESLSASARMSQHEVVPILLARCTICHGGRRQEGGLDLRTRASMLRGGKSGSAIIPGNAENSLLLRRIRSGDMPPREHMLEVSVRPISEAETQKLAAWIAQGAPEDASPSEPNPPVNDQDRRFWSFRVPHSPAVPKVREAQRVRNPIDAFILRKLKDKGLSFSPEADRLTLIRRATFDLTGLPPEPVEVKAFLADRSPQAYENLIDRLLASPRYGERWAQNWLDAVGYSDSEGKLNSDPIRPVAFRYRDYVIRSFSADKPYNRFLLEQIAGDEIEDYENAPVATQTLMDNLIATGFLRMAPDATNQRDMNFLDDRHEVIADSIDIFASTVLGLTLKCARCHNHKHEPFSQQDYFRLADVFKGAYDEHDWLAPSADKQNPGRYLPHVTPGATPMQVLRQQQRDEEINRRIQEQTAEHQAALKKAEEAAALRVQQRRPPVGSPKLDARALRSADEEYRRVWEDLESKIRLLEASRPPEPKIRALWDRGSPSPTYILRGGNPVSFGHPAVSGVPSVLVNRKAPFKVTPPWPGAYSTGRRLALARWLVRPDHPLTARVMVNRIWRHHFVSGIVKTLANFGPSGAQPSHPELLDWLASKFVRSGWSMKAMHRLMMTSSTYRQSSHVTAGHEQSDPDNALLSRMPMRRMEAEVLNDTMLLVSGRLDETRYGFPAPVLVHDDGRVVPIGTHAGWRRSIYTLRRRKDTPTLLANFDYPLMDPNCVERVESVVAPQALYLRNDRLVRALATGFAARVEREAGPDASRRVEHAWWLALSRPPSEEEKSIALQFLQRVSGESEALSGLAHTLFNSAAFLYID